MFEVEDAATGGVELFEFAEGGGEVDEAAVRPEGLGEVFCGGKLTLLRLAMAAAVKEDLAHAVGHDREEVLAVEDGGFEAAGFLGVGFLDEVRDLKAAGAFGGHQCGGHPAKTRRSSRKEGIASLPIAVLHASDQ